MRWGQEVEGTGNIVLAVSISLLPLSPPPPWGISPVGGIHWLIFRRVAIASSADWQNSGKRPPPPPTSLAVRKLGKKRKLNIPAKN